MSGDSDDRVLQRTLDILILAISSGRQIFPNPLEEPILYTLLHRWVLEGIEERRKAQAVEEQTKELTRL